MIASIIEPEEAQAIMRADIIALIALNPFCPFARKLADQLTAL